MSFRLNPLLTDRFIVKNVGQRKETKEGLKDSDANQQEQKPTTQFGGFLFLARDTTYLVGYPPKTSIPMGQWSEPFTSGRIKASLSWGANDLETKT